jgi:MoaA/NifB/PqqE/SkfB family radical SAM enzyme
MLTQSETIKRKWLQKRKPLAAAKATHYPDKVARGESIAKIQYQHSFKCNFSCEHCSVADFRKMKDRPPLTLGDVRNVFDQAHELGLAHISVSGGEPLAFPDLPKLLEAIGPERFCIQLDTNGWLMNAAMAKRLASMGVDKIQISLDSAFASEHDEFRHKKGSWNRVIHAVDYIKASGMRADVATTVTGERSRSKEFGEFLEMTRKMDVATSIVWAKPVGAWRGYYDGVATQDDIDRMDGLRQKGWNVYDHTTPGYGLPGGCLAARRMVSLTPWGDVMPCLWMYFTIGNVRDKPLAEILARGMKYFGQYRPDCRMATSRAFVENIERKTTGKKFPVDIADVLTKAQA